MKTFSVIEYSSFFAIRHNPTGEEHPMGDGVDTLFEEQGPLIPGTPGFVEAWEDSLNANESETLKAYFPNIVVISPIVERLHPSGDYLVSDIVRGEYLKHRYGDYSEREAVDLFREYVQEQTSLTVVVESGYEGAEDQD